MLDCLNNLIGLRGCSTDEPASGLYLNYLPGITLKQIQRIANSEQQNYLGVWAEIQENASNTIFADFQNLVNYYYKINCCAENCDIESIFCSYVSQLAVPYRYLLGATLMTERLYSERLNWFTTIGKDQAEELKDFYTVEYEKYLKNAVKAIPKEILAGCYECSGGRISYQSNLP